MDVRCERCGTEYELDEASVPDAGTQVQCSECGHTFMALRPGTTAPPPRATSSTPSAGAGIDGGPPAADWLLQTSDGQTHRFRDLTVLQKWIIERKVTRNDRVSRTGQA